MVEVMKKVSESYVENAEIAKGLYPDAVVMDVTMDGLRGRLDPGSRWGEVRVPGREKEMGLSLRGVWEGLKLFSRRKEVDEKWWKDEKLLEKERNCKSYGKLKGISFGEEAVTVEKGKEIFERVYREEVERRFGRMIEGLRKESARRVVVDYNEGDKRKFINHAEIFKDIRFLYSQPPYKKSE